MTPERELRERLAVMQGAAEMLWVVLANVSGGDWSKQNEEWQKAAARWRDNYFKALTACKAAAPAPTSAPPTYHAYCSEHDLRLVDGRCDKCRDAIGNTFVLDMQSTYLRPAEPTVPERGPQAKDVLLRVLTGHRMTGSNPDAPIEKICECGRRFIGLLQHDTHQRDEQLKVISDALAAAPRAAGGGNE